jgi:hypothetical protein
MLTEISYPVTGSIGTYQNKFPSQVPLYMEFTRYDETIITIVSGVDNKVRLTVSTAIPATVGQYVTWQTDGYSLRSSKVLSIIAADTIEVDENYTVSTVTNSFINYFQNWILEIRYVLDNSATDDQDAILLLDDYSQVPNKKDGTIRVNINAPADLLRGVFVASAGIEDNLFKKYKLQYRESYDGNRSGTWISPTLDIPILLVHAADDLGVNLFTDFDLPKRYVRGYPLFYSLIYSSVNDAGSNNLKIFLTQYAIDKTVISTDEIESLLDIDGVYVIMVDTVALDSDCVFLEFTSLLSSSNLQYDPDDYDPSQYA